MKKLTRDETEHGQHYYLASEIDAALAQPAQEPVQRGPIPKAQSLDELMIRNRMNQSLQKADMEADMLTISYQSGYHDGKKAALAGREWNFCERCGKRTADLTVIHTCTPAAQPVQQEALYGMNQDDWKDVVAAIAKVRDGRGIYLGCRPADVFKDWFLALGTAKVKEKNG